MGLEITQTNTQYGLDLVYWKIGEVRVDWHRERCRVQLLGFVNKVQRDAGKAPVETRYFHFDATDFSFDHATSIVDQAYVEIKSHVDWDTAVDVME